MPNLPQHPTANPANVGAMNALRGLLAGAGPSLDQSGSLVALTIKLYGDNTDLRRQLDEEKNKRHRSELQNAKDEALLAGQVQGQVQMTEKIVTVLNELEAENPTIAESLRRKFGV